MLLSTVVAAAACEQSGQAEQTTTDQAGAAASAPRDPLLSPFVPHDASFTAGDSTLDSLQNAFDVYSWQTFVALNWPVGANGQADSAQTIGANGDNATVWETYKESYQVFLPGGARPSPWGDPRVPPEACRNVTAPAGTPVFRMTQKAPEDVLDEMQEPFETGPLIDQDSNYVRFAIHMNQDAFEYITRNGLFNADSQKAAPPVQFPVGDTLRAGPTGAIVLKSSWKVLGPRDRPERFHTSRVLVYTDSSSTTNPPTRQSCALRTLGLVGFHIAHKTNSAPQWLWSTFEQVDNVRVPAGSGLRPNFHDPACTGCPANQPPPQPWNPDVKAPPTQLVREIPIDSATQTLNAQWQARLRGVNGRSVWQFYELVSTQWPTAPGADPDGPNALGNPAPRFLANTTLESYIQGRVPNVSSSCIGCHNNATTTTGAQSDFSYLLERAQATVAARRGQEN
jgi:hypothetical protein